MKRLGTATICGLLALGFVGCARPATHPRPATKSTTTEQKQPCDAPVDVRAGPPRYPFAQITTVSVRCGANESGALHAVGAMPSTVAQWKNDRTLVITIPPGIRVLDRKPSVGQVAIETVPRLRESDLLYGALPTNRWPSTCADAAKQVIAGLSPESVAIIRGLSPADFGQLRQSWGALLSRHFALTDENLAMLDACGGPPDVSAGADLVDLIGKGVRGSPSDIDAAAAALRGKRASSQER